YHVAVYQKTKCLVKPKEIDLNVNSKELNQIKKQFPNYFVYEDFHQISQPGINFPQKISFDKKNQGIVAFIREYNYIGLSSLLRMKPNYRFPLLVMLDGVEDPHNFGAILRTCAALKIDGVIIATKNQVQINSTVVKVSMGGAAYVPVCQVSNLLVVLNELKKANYQIISAVCHPEAQNYKKIKLNSPTCLVFGNESQGIRQKIIQKSDQKVYIPINKQIGSLNVS
ncbi:24069_t:CDS:2, partial [Racocetra persica]